MVATSTSSCHARTPCSDNHIIRISHTSFSLWILMDPWTLQNRAIFVPSFCLLESPWQKYYRNSWKLSDPYIYQYILCQIFSFSEYIQKCFRHLLLANKLSRLLVIFFQYFSDQVCWIFRCLLYSSLRFLVRFADGKIIGRSISAADYALATSSILLYPLTEIL